MEKAKEKSRDKRKIVTRIIAILMVIMLLSASAFTLIFYLVQVTSVANA